MSSSGKNPETAVFGRNRGPVAAFCPHSGSFCRVRELQPLQSLCSIGGQVSRSTVLAGTRRKLAYDDSRCDK
ncbi:MAG: hypothetical protein ACFFB3_20590 [Candidatus Hodarchaeota archaeon]